METVGNLRAEEILEALDNEQRAVALATRGPVCVIAGAGTGNGTKQLQQRKFKFFQHILFILA